MLRWSPLIFLGSVLLLAGCTALDEVEVPEDLVPLSELPADYGELVTVVHTQGSGQTSRWDELWFENEDTGTLTRVFLYRPTWSWDPSYTRHITRVESQTETGR